MSPLTGGRGQWRSLEREAERAAQEFPGIAEALAHPLDRRRTLKLLAASLALGGLSGCDDPGSGQTRLVPAVIAPPGIIPGVPNRYSTAHVHDGYGTGIVVTHAMGRPFKVEGNPNHPSSLGATDIFSQAAILDFYDPDRSGSILAGGQPSNQVALATALTAQRARLAKTRGAGFRILTGTVTSPTLGAALDAVLKQYPDAQWHQWEPASRDTVRNGAAAAYGRMVDAVYHPDRADVILAIDSDLISSAPGHLSHARGFASRRNPTRGPMSRVYAVEPVPGLIGAAGDHRFVAGPRDLPLIMTALAAHVLGGDVPAGAPDWVAAVAEDLQAHRGSALVHVGPDQPAEMHALAHALNEALGGRGAVFDLIEPVEHAPVDQGASLQALMAKMQAGTVETLLVLGVNPAYTVPGFTDALGRVKFSLSSAPRLDETAPLTSWHVPQAHEFETWSDVRGHDGTAVILQPQALPLYGGWNPVSLLSVFLGPDVSRPLPGVQQTWRGRLGDPEAWRDALAAGVVPDSASPRADLALSPAAGRIRPSAPPSESLNLTFRPDPHVWDGRYANNAWLQELPRPLTKLVWDNPLLISPQMAAARNLVNGQVATLRVGERQSEVPVWINPGQAPDFIVGLLGFGRRAAGEVGNHVGVDLYPLRGGSGAVSLDATDRHVPIASTDHHNVLKVDDESTDDIVRHGMLADFENDAHFLNKEEEKPSLYYKPAKEGIGWGMSIDLNSCIGCNACVIACQAENNVPTVGKQQVLMEREMHWLRIDRYYEGPAEDPDAYFQPMLCMHCEEAPCEIVCPVEATLHDHEGLNLQVYNRCIGTRFCSNNCPYKVRRFNFFAYADENRRRAESWNPDVTVRARGVMEKCTFCVQRIAEARIVADRENDPGLERQVTTACAAACPTQVFTFGDVHDPQSPVSARKKSPLNYQLLEEAATHPRVSFEAKIRNPNPRIASA